MVLGKETAVAVARVGVTMEGVAFTATGALYFFAAAALLGGLCLHCLLVRLLLPGIFNNSQKQQRKLGRDGVSRTVAQNSGVTSYKIYGLPR